MLEVILQATFWTGLVLGILSFYQLIYVIVGYFAKKAYPDTENMHAYAFLIAARNEEGVIAELIKSIKNCDYDQSLVRIFVVADNCSDNTAQAAREAGAVVFERFNTQEIGKGYALDFLLKAIGEAMPDYQPDGYFVFDADNLLEKQYIKEMNKAFDAGERIITSYRNCKNFNSNWISAVSGMTFMHWCRFQHFPRAALNVSTTVSGTGWLITSQLLNGQTGFPYHTLTEDTEASCDFMLKGEKIAYCDAAVFYDEQPLTLKDCYNQRMRWIRGNWQCTRKFFGKFTKSFFKTGKFCFYDVFCTTLGVMGLVGTLLVAFNAIYPLVSTIISLAAGEVAAIDAINSFITVELGVFAGTYISMMLYASLILIIDWKRIAGSTKYKLMSVFLYPFFQILIMPIQIIALFRSVKWTQIPHNDVKSIAEVNDELSVNKQGKYKNKEKD